MFGKLPAAINPRGILKAKIEAALVALDICAALRNGANMRARGAGFRLHWFLRDSSASIATVRKRRRLWRGKSLGLFHQVDALAARPFRVLSDGHQRLALLARAFVKQPRLLILDRTLPRASTHAR